MSYRLGCPECERWFYFEGFEGGIPKRESVERCVCAVCGRFLILDPTWMLLTRAASCGGHAAECGSVASKAARSERPGVRA